MTRHPALRTSMSALELCRSAVVLAVAISFSLTVGAKDRQGAPTADILIVNARIYTVNPRQPWASAIAISGEKIVAIGSRDQVQRLRGRTTRVIDAGQRLLLPGFIDSHIHFYEGSVTLLRLDLTGVKTVAEFQERLRSFAASHPQGWIVGRGWTYDIFGAEALPHKKFIDDVVRDRPVFLVGYDGHTYWANSKALALAGIHRESPDPPNSVIVRDASGEPTGALKEDFAAALVYHVIPAPTHSQRLDALRRGLSEANRLGLTGAYGAGGTAESDDFELLDLFDELRAKGQLTVRVYAAYYLDPAAPVSTAMARIEGVRLRHHDDWVSAGAAKVYLDGVVESHTAAMLQPYSDDPNLAGSLFWDPDKYKRAVAKLDRHGVQVFTHATGDRAVRLALDAYQQAQRANGTRDARHRIEHIENISAQDIPRFGEIGAVAAFQPLHAYPGENLLKVWARNTGPERASRGWAWQSIAKAGGHLAFGSDWPVVTLNPWDGLQTALTRQTFEGDPPSGWFPSQCVTLDQAIAAYTLGAAYAGRREKSVGSLEVGKLADLVILSQDLFQIDPHQIHNTEVLLTMVGGKVVYQSATWKDHR